MTLRRLQLDTSWGPLRIVGGSRAGEATLVLLPQLKLAFDAGRPHRALPPMSAVLISHGHADHLGALGYWASQRHLNAMGPATVLAPEEIAGAVRRLLELHADLEGGRRYAVEVVALADGDRWRLRPDVELELFDTAHWVPTLGARVIWSKRRLRAELAGLTGDEIAARRAAGEEVSEVASSAIACYCADSGPRLLAERPEALAAEVVLLECSFFRPSDRERAGRYGHLHIDDLAAAAAALQCRHLVLLHGSRRNRLREVETVVDERLRPLLGCELHHLMVDWD